MWAHSTIALPSADDETALHPGCDPGPRLAALGAREVAVKHGAAGPVLWPRIDDAGDYPVAASVIDTTGAGDGFDAGCVAARQPGHDRPPRRRRPGERSSVPPRCGDGVGGDGARRTRLRRREVLPRRGRRGRRDAQGVAGALPGLRFCPTGGVTGDNAGGYLALANVACVGGSWIAPAGRVAAADWAGITDLARAGSEELTRLRPD